MNTTDDMIRQIAERSPTLVVGYVVESGGGQYHVRTAFQGDQAVLGEMLSSLDKEINRNVWEGSGHESA